MTQASGYAGDPGFERQADASIRRLESLSDRVLGASETPALPLVAEMLEELSAAVEEFEVSTEEIHVQNEALAEAKKQLDLESARYRELFDLAPDGYLVTNTLGIILEANRAASELLGTPGHFLDQKPVVVFVDAADRRLVLNHLHDAVARRHGPVVEFEARFAPPNHESFPASVHLTVGGAADPADPRVRWLVRDVSRRLEAERALVASETRYRPSRRAQPTSSSQPTRWAASPSPPPLSSGRSPSIRWKSRAGRSPTSSTPTTGPRCRRCRRTCSSAGATWRRCAVFRAATGATSRWRPGWLRSATPRTAPSDCSTCCVTSGSAKRPGSRCKRR